MAVGRASSVSHESSLLPEGWGKTPHIDLYLNFLKVRCETEKKEDPLYQVALKVIRRESISDGELTMPAGLKVESGVSSLDEKIGAFNSKR